MLIRPEFVSFAGNKPSYLIALFKDFLLGHAPTAQMGMRGF
jgi:hypothetical protein